MASFSNPISPPPELRSDGGFSLDYEVSPTILLSIIILAIIFFFAGLLHLLLRLFLSPQIRTEHEDSAVDGGPSAFQGQLRHLFHLYDAGVDQTFIDALPVFPYKAIIGPELLDPFDCSVCLSEFQPDDKLRLLTQCSHGFHMECIDTWLLTHSTCPLCRASLVSDLGVLDSASNSSREIGEIQAGSFLGFLGEGSDLAESKRDDPTVVAIKLGKFKSLERNGEGSSNDNNGNVDSRRCFSMGSFGYVMDENSSLQVPIRAPPAGKKRNLQLKPGNRAVMSECDCISRREFSFGESNRSKVGGGGGGGAMAELARRAFSFHFPGNGNRPRSENGMGTMDEENQRRNSFEFADQNGASFVRRTLQRLLGRNTNNRIVHSSFTPNDDHSHS